MGYKIFIGVLGIVVMGTFVFFTYDKFLKPVFFAGVETYNPEGYRKMTNKEFSKPEREYAYNKYVWREEIIIKKENLLSALLYNDDKICTNESGGASDYTYTNPHECGVRSIYRNSKTGKQVDIWGDTKCEDFASIGFPKDFDEFIIGICKE